ncbi:uncharacterized protein [Choristoneura fumiferana]|uniref:uncharacterized protein n=1 Tax=Choristoneura fumiferana TaxID=7141 RepID=UPI003D15E2F3
MPLSLHFAINNKTAAVARSNLSQDEKREGSGIGSRGHRSSDKERNSGPAYHSQLLSKCVSPRRHASTADCNSKRGIDTHFTGAKRLLLITKATLISVLSPSQ